MFGAPGSDAYSPDSLSQFLTDAADTQFERFGDGSISRPPAITTQPVSATINPGQSATLSVVASGSSLTYQWQLGGMPIPGATAATYEAGSAGRSTVTVTNSRGSATSNAAIVAVRELPTATVQPAAATINQGQTVTLTASATGTAPFTYQWSNANGQIPGATASTYTTDTGGVYTVTVRNAAGSSTATATVTVAFPPEITQQPTWKSSPRSDPRTV